MSLSYKDIAGQVIKPGDTVLYASLWDRSATLKYGRVTRLCGREDQGLYGKRKEVPTIRVVTVDRDWDGKWEIQKKGTEVTLMFLDRMLVVFPAQVPAEVVRLLQPK